MGRGNFSIMQWEYLEMRGEEIAGAGKLDALGKEGWELVTMLYVKDVGVYFYFKRPLKP